MYVCAHTQTHTHTHTHSHTRTHTHIRAHTYTYARRCTHGHTHTLNMSNVGFSCRYIFGSTIASDHDFGQVVAFLVCCNVCIMLQCVAVCCSVLQCDHCVGSRLLPSCCVPGGLQCVAVCCCSVLQCVAVLDHDFGQIIAFLVCCSVCIMLQYVGMRCFVLQCIGVCC